MEQLKQVTVLYVEDQANLREELGAFIKRRVKKVFIAENGIQGLDMFKKEKPDIVITDIKMPKMDGIEMTKAIRQENLLVPIIVTTAMSDVESILSTVDIGIDKYLLKPIDVNELNEALKSASEKILIVNGASVEDSSLSLETIETIEKEIQRALAKFFKDNVGKGPRKIIAKVNGPFIQVQVMESRCIYEKTLCKRPEFIKMVDYTRQSFYEATKKQLDSLVGKIVNRKVEMTNTDMDSRLDIDVIDFKMI